jgi:hypothetical protein
VCYSLGVHCACCTVTGFQVAEYVHFNTFITDGCPITCLDAEAKALACDIEALQKVGKIYLKPDHFNALGNDPYDGASALDNIKDACIGNTVKRCVQDKRLSIFTRAVRVSAGIL